ncbi:MAG TPA: D-2-hydroxyacid dehydrogenase [Candidatus Acidoferrales bacterium]|nr:D-2-hydroxyacid dehydrogenase [Candidatus Acidoferrales bacterium]
MSRPAPSETKLLICVWHPFTLWRPPPEMAARVRERWPEMSVVHLPTYDRMPEELADTDIFVGYSIRVQQFARARKLKWIHSTAAGVAQLMYPELRSSGVVVTNASGVHTVPMAEHILGMLIALARHFPDAVRYQQERRWAQQEIWDKPLRPRELAGQVLAIVGFGAVGRELARRVKPLGMKIWAVTRSGRADQGLAERVFAVAQLGDALSRADFVVLAAPETRETRHLIGARQLEVMKPSAYLISVARGSLVDEPALVAALERRAIAGAALDVAAEEPLPPESPLWTLENVFITPHISAASESLWDRQTALLLENLERWFSGRELLNRVDLTRGY